MEISTPVYRFKFQNTLVSEIEYFAKVHQYDDRNTFKESWAKWIEEEETKNMIQSEIQYLKQQGYEGDILQKMFKSARYYFRTKPNDATAQHDTAEKNKRKKYSGLSDEMLQRIDTHLLEMVKNQLQQKPITPYKHSVVEVVDISPANAYADFSKTYPNEIAEEYSNNANSISLTQDEFQKKIKKTYKNRYFIMIRRKNLELVLVSTPKPIPTPNN
jgi:hypothetical protein